MLLIAVIAIVVGLCLILVCTTHVHGSGRKPKPNGRLEYPEVFKSNAEASEKKRELYRRVSERMKKM
jgi:hypothetical protein